MMTMMMMMITFTGHLLEGHFTYVTSFNLQNTHTK